MRRLRFLEDADVAIAAPAVRTTLTAGGVVLLPTESFYGLGADPRSPAGVAAVFHAKGRPGAMPLPVLAADWVHVESLVEVPDRYRVRLSRTWPAALTAVLPAREPVPAAAGARTLAVRIPAHERLRALLYLVGPVTGTSANRHGAPPSVTADGAIRGLAQPPDLVLDGGVTRGEPPSTLVDLTGDEPVVLRPGRVPW